MVASAEACGDFFFFFFWPCEPWERAREAGSEGPTMAVDPLSSQRVGSSGLLGHWYSRE